MRRRWLRGPRLVALIVAVGIVVEIPLAVYVLTRDDSAPSVVVRPTSPAVTSSAVPLHPAAGNFRPDGTTLAECKDQTCIEQALGNVAYRQGPAVAFRLVAKRYEGGADPRCHTIAHVIGAAVLARNDGNIARTFAEGSSMCWSGYYHGVLERAFRDVKSFDAATLGAKSRALCADRQVRRSSWLSYQCLHGLGHGLTITTGYQLPIANKVCNRLATAWDRTSCKGGVFMENFITSYGGDSPWVRDSDPLYPCDWVARADKYTCYQQATTRIIQVVGLDWQKIARTCAGAEADWVQTCFGSFGQNASVVASRRPGKIVPICAVARPYGGERECIRYAAMDIAGAYSGGKEAASLCDASPGKLRGDCYEAIGHMIRYLQSSEAARRAECRSLTATPRYAAQCIAGTTKTSAVPGQARAPAR
jgi:hypothetical protein